MKNTTVVTFPFDCFGGAGTSEGAILMEEVIDEILEDAATEKRKARSRVFAGKIHTHSCDFSTLEKIQNWEATAHQVLQKLLGKEFILWCGGNHLSVKPVYEHLPADTLVIQFDAHLDVYHLHEVEKSLSHGNFLIHLGEKLPPIVQIGHRDLFLPQKHISKYFTTTFSSLEWSKDPHGRLAEMATLVEKYSHIWLDIDCDVFDPVYFPATGHHLPLGLSPREVVSAIDALWSEKVLGVSFSEFLPTRDVQDTSLTTLGWVLEWLLLKIHEV
ncbi:MAG: arginase family protein [Zavarzinella sp.]